MNPGELGSLLTSMGLGQWVITRPASPDVNPCVLRVQTDMEPTVSQLKELHAAAMTSYGYAYLYCGAANFFVDFCDPYGKSWDFGSLGLLSCSREIAE